MVPPGPPDGGTCEGCDVGYGDRLGAIPSDKGNLDERLQFLASTSEEEEDVATTPSPPPGNGAAASGAAAGVATPASPSARGGGAGPGNPGGSADPVEWEDTPPLYGAAPPPPRFQARNNRQAPDPRRQPGSARATPKARGGFATVAEGIRASDSFKTPLTLGQKPGAARRPSAGAKSGPSASLSDFESGPRASGSIPETTEEGPSSLPSAPSASPVVHQPPLNPEQVQKLLNQGERLAEASARAQRVRTNGFMIAKPNYRQKTTLAQERARFGGEAAKPARRRGAPSSGKAAGLGPRAGPASKKQKAASPTGMPVKQLTFQGTKGSVEPTLPMDSASDNPFDPPIPGKGLSVRPLDLTSYLSPHIAGPYLEAKKMRRLHKWQAACLTSYGTDHVLSVLDHRGDNLVYCAPTSGGKSLVAEILMVRRICMGAQQGKMALLVLPYVAICEEKAKLMETVLQNTKIGVVKNYGTHGVGRELPSAAIVVCTIEKAKRLVDRLIQDRAMERLCMVVVDEFHVVGSGDPRGCQIELMLTKLLFTKRMADATGFGLPEAKDGELPEEVQFQIVGMSATIPKQSREKLSEWLGARLFVTDFRPVPEKRYLVVGNAVKEWSAEDQKRRTVRALEPPAEGAPEAFEPPRKSGKEDFSRVAHLAYECLKEPGGHSVLVFCSTKKKCEQCVEDLAKRFAAAGYSVLAPASNGNEETVKHLAYVGSQNKALRAAVRAGLAFHNSSLTAEERTVVEEAFSSHRCRLIAATSTLAAGVNIPARRVIFHEHFSWTSDAITKHSGFTLLTDIRYQQMSGRAGRLGLDDLGESFLLLPRSQSSKGPKTSEDELMRLMCGDLEKPMASLLEGDNNLLSEALLEAISCGAIKGAFSVEDYLQCTLLGSMLGKEKLKSEAEDGFVKEKFMPSIKRLTNMNLVEWKNSRPQEPGDAGEWVITQHGGGLAASGLSPDCAQEVRRALDMAGRRLVLATEAHLIYLGTPILEAPGMLTKDLGPWEWAVLERRIDNDDHVAELAEVLELGNRKDGRWEDDSWWKAQAANAQGDANMKSAKMDAGMRDISKCAKCRQLLAEGLANEGLPMILEERFRSPGSVCWFDEHPVMRWQDIKTVNGKGTLVTVKVSWCKDCTKKKRDIELYRRAVRLFHALVLTDLVQEKAVDYIVKTYSAPLPDEKGGSKGKRKKTEDDIERLREKAGQFLARVKHYCAHLTDKPAMQQLATLLELFEQRVDFGVKPELLELVQVPFVGRGRARMFFNQGIQSVNDIVKLRAEDLARVLAQYERGDGEQGYRERDTAKKILEGAKAMHMQRQQEAVAAAENLRSVNDAVDGTQRGGTIGTPTQSARAFMPVLATEQGQIEVVCSQEGLKALREELDKETCRGFAFQFILNPLWERLFCPKESQIENPQVGVQNPEIGGVVNSLPLSQEDVKAVKGLMLHLELLESDGSAGGLPKKATYYVQFPFEALSSNLTAVEAFQFVEYMLGKKRVGDEAAEGGKRLYKFTVNLKRQWKALIWDFAGVEGVELPAFGEGDLVDIRIAQWMLTPAETFVWDSTDWANLSDTVNMGLLNRGRYGKSAKKNLTKFSLHVLVQNIFWPVKTGAQGEEEEEANQLQGEYATLLKEKKVWDSHNSTRYERAIRLSYESVFLCLPAGKRLRKVLQRVGLWKVFMVQEMRMAHVLARMEMTGTSVDQNELDDKKLKATRDRVVEKCQVMAAEAAGLPKGRAMEFSLDSSDECKRALAPVLRQHHLEVPYDTRRDTLLGLLDKDEKVIPLAQLIVTGRKLTKCMETIDEVRRFALFKSPGEPEFLRIRTNFLHTTAETGRICMDSPNLQCLQKPQVHEKLLTQSQPGTGADELLSPAKLDLRINLRKAIKARPGNCILSCDFAQVELRFIAHFSQDKVMIDSFNAERSVDPFKALAMKWRGLNALEDVSGQDRERAKRIAYGLVYGMGHKALARELGITPDDARRERGAFLDMLGKFTKWRREELVKAKKSGHVTTLSGRRRPFNFKVRADGQKKNADEQAANERSAVNTICQGSAADLLKMAIIKVEAKFRQEGMDAWCNMFLQIHDELLFEVPCGRAYEAAKIIKETMESAAELEVKLKVKVHMGRSWGELEEIAVPEGDLEETPHADMDMG